MQFVVKFIGIAAVAFIFASCHNDVPGLPSLEEVKNYQYCKYCVKDEDGNDKDECVCKSAYEITKTYCAAVKGTLYEDKESCDEACKVP